MSPLSLLQSGGAAARPGSTSDLLERKRLRNSGSGGWRLTSAYPAALVWMAIMLAVLVTPASSNLIAGGGNHSLGVRANGTVLGSGCNGSGQAIPPGDLGSVVGVAAGNAHSLALKPDGTVEAWGANYYNQCDFPPA